MGAGNACSSNKIRLNGNTGGNKLQGLASTIGRVGNINYNRSYGNNRDMVFHINQLGGIGRKKSMFLPGADGVRVAQRQIFNNATIREAVNNWCVDVLNATQKYGDISTWNTSGVTDMNSLFKNKEYFNGDISSWDVSNVTDMNNIFKGAKIFNGDIGSWDVSSVTNMESMFESAFVFNQNLDSWNVSSVTNMDDMFIAAVEMYNGGSDESTKLASSWRINSVESGEPINNDYFEIIEIIPNYRKLHIMPY